MGVCNCSMFCCTLLYVHSSIAIILIGKRELIALLNLSSWCLVMVERLFLEVPRDKLHKRPYKSRFIANSSACTTTELSILLTSCLTAIKNHVIKYCTTVYERNGKNLFWSIKNSGEILNKLKSRGFLASGLSTYDFSTLYTTLPHNLIKEKLTELIEQTFNREGSLYLACNDKNAFFTSEQPKRYKLWSCQKMCDALHYLLDNIFIRFGSKVYTCPKF